MLMYENDAAKFIEVQTYLLLNYGEKFERLKKQIIEGNLIPLRKM